MFKQILSCARTRFRGQLCFVHLSTDQSFFGWPTTFLQHHSLVHCHLKSTTWLPNKQVHIQLWLSKPTAQTRRQTHHPLFCCQQSINKNRLIYQAHAQRLGLIRCNPHVPSSTLRSLWGLPTCWPWFHHLEKNWYCLSWSRCRFMHSWQMWGPDRDRQLTTGHFPLLCGKNGKWSSVRLCSTQSLELWPPWAQHLEDLGLVPAGTVPEDHGW